MNTKKLYVVLGPTAIGKTSYSIEMALKLNTEIISADSRQFYKEMSIGTAVPTNEELKKVKHHFIHNKSILQEYNVGHFQNEALEKINQLFKKNDTLILTGGSGLYIDSICYGLNQFPEIDQSIRTNLRSDFENKGIQWLKNQVNKLDPEYYKIVDTNNPQRLLRCLEVCQQSDLPYSYYLNKEKPKRQFEINFIGLKMDREKLYQRINKRVDIMIEKGLVKEVESLTEYQNLNALQTVGYKEVFDYLNQKTSLQKTIELIKQNSRRYAKRQITWLKKYNAKWIEL